MILFGDHDVATNVDFARNPDFDLELEVQENMYYAIGYLNYVDGKIAHTAHYDDRRVFR